MRRLFVLMMVSAMVVVLVQPVLALQPFPDTGQTKCYDNEQEITCPAPGEPFYGQDAQYQPRLPRSYTKLGMNGVELAVDALHVDDGGPWIMTRDNVTGLIWELKTEANKDDTYNWQDAQDVFISGLDSAGFGGFNDWRLPEIGELASLVNRGIFDPAIDVEWFPNTLSSGYWSATTFVPDTNRMWVVFFGIGHYFIFPIDTMRMVRAVRAGQAGSLKPLVINGDGTITDPNTGLMWQEQTAPDTYTWQAALAYSESLSLGGYSDWRLPNLNELKTLVDYSRYNPAIDPILADKTEASWYWSSTSHASVAHRAWFVDMVNGLILHLNTNLSIKTNSWYVRAVRVIQDSFGNLVISIEPAEARAAGAQWRRVGTNIWYNSGDTESNVPTGTHTIEFKTVPGWRPIEQITVNVQENTTTTSTGTYVEHTGTSLPGVLMLLLDEEE